MNQAKTALITGASGGLGFELTRLAAADGYRLVLVARAKSKLEDVAAQMRARHAVTVDVIAADLSVSGAAQAVHAEVQRKQLAVDVLINNAGFAIFGLFFENDLAAVDGMLQTNIAALTLLTRLFLPEMIARKSGKILNVASTAAFAPGPLMAAYYASKAYVLSFSEAIAEELRGSGVTLTTLAPGPTRTGFWARAAIEDSRLATGILVMDAADVAKAGYRAMLEGKMVCVPGFLNRMLGLAARMSPPSMAARIARHMQERIR